MLRIIWFCAALVLFSGLAAPAGAAEAPKEIGTFGKWSAYTFMEDGHKVCYMASQPTKDEGKYAKRGDIYALITHRPSEGSRNVFSYISGYDYKPASDASLQLGDKSFVLFTQGETAWAADAETDEAIVNALRAGSTMVVKGTSSRGTETKDTFSLSGSASAHDAISKECGVK